MKEIQSYVAEKYLDSERYKKVGDNIYQTCDSFSIVENEEIFVTSLSFVQEPEFNEETDSRFISQYPLENILDRFSCWISDSYQNMNHAGSERCYQEFASYDIENIMHLHSVIGKHVYTEDDGELIIS